MTVISRSQIHVIGTGVPSDIAWTLLSGFAVGSWVTLRDGKKCNGFRYIYHFYSLAAETTFYGHIGRVVGFTTKLSDIYRS